LDLDAGLYNWISLSLFLVYPGAFSTPLSPPLVLEAGNVPWVLEFPQFEWLSPNLGLTWDLGVRQQAPCFQHMSCAKKNSNKISTLHSPAMVHLTSMWLPWTINMLWDPHANIVPKHKIIQQKIQNQCTTYCNA